MYTINIGGLLTEYRPYSFSSIQSKHLVLSHSLLLQEIAQFKRAETVFVLLRNILSLTEDQIWSLTIGDITYILTVLRTHSLTQAPITVTWQCSSHAYADQDGVFYYDQKAAEIRARTEHVSIKQCDQLNSELVYSNNYSYKPVMLTNFTPDDKFHLPTLLDQHLVDEMSDMPDWPEYAKFSDFFLCCKGKTIDEKKKALTSIDDLREARAYLSARKFGVGYSYTLTCNGCMSKVHVDKMLDLYSAIPVLSQESAMNIQYSLMRDMHVMLPDSTPILKALFWHSQHKKEKQERKAKRDAAKASGGKRRS